MNTAARYWLLVCAVVCLAAGACTNPSPAPSLATYTNPLLPAGADPWVAYRDGMYYYIHTTGIDLTIRKTRRMVDLALAEPVTVWTPPAAGPHSHGIWAPELHFLDGAWYLYFAADAGENESHRLWVLENPSPDPTVGTWTMKGKLADPSDRWAIDGTVFEHAGKRYLAWSGWEGETNGAQHLYLALMENPWTLAGWRVRIASPTYPWETVGDLTDAGDGLTHVDVNEGPQFLRRQGEDGNQVFIVFSASGCWTDAYTLGLLAADAGSDLLDPASWIKYPQPVFTSGPGAHAAGHNSFFTSPDGTEDWILYHANPEPGLGCGARRSPRMQRFTWNADGTPRFGPAAVPGVETPGPAGE